MPHVCYSLAYLKPHSLLRSGIPSNLSFHITLIFLSLHIHIYSECVVCFNWGLNPSSGGACGWEDDVQNPPLSAMISAGNANIFLNGKGCGHCFQILCNTPPYCLGKPVTVTISDECPGACNDVPIHFDLSGAAFGAMANPGNDHDLRNLGQVDVQFRRVPCEYGGTRIAFKVDRGCNPSWFAVAIEYADGDGGFKSVEIAASGGKKFIHMDNLWGAVWKADIDPSFHSPYSFRLTSGDGKIIVAKNVIPQDFTAGQKYSSVVNFN